MTNLAGASPGPLQIEKYRQGLVVRNIKGSCKPEVINRWMYSTWGCFVHADLPKQIYIVDFKASDQQMQVIQIMSWSV